MKDKVEKARYPMGWWGFEGYHFNRVTCARREGNEYKTRQKRVNKHEGCVEGAPLHNEIEPKEYRSMYRRLPTRLARRMNAEKRAKFADRVPRRRADSGLSRKVCRCLCAASSFPSVGNVLSSCILLPSVSLAMCSLVT